MIFLHTNQDISSKKDFGGHCPHPVFGIRRGFSGNTANVIRLEQFILYGRLFWPLLLQILGEAFPTAYSYNYVNPICQNRWNYSSIYFIFSSIQQYINSVTVLYPLFFAILVRRSFSPVFLSMLILSYFSFGICLYNHMTLSYCHSTLSIYIPISFAQETIYTPFLY